MRRVLWIAVLSALVLWLDFCQADILYVPSASYATINAAVSAANDGDTISLARGKFTESDTIEIKDKILNFVTTSGLTDVIINVPRADLPVFRLSGSTVLISHVELNGQGGSSSCVVATKSTLNFTSVFIHDCSASAADGGAISSSSNSVLRATGCRFTDNRALNRCDKCVGGAIFSDYSLWITECTFTRNSASSGGAIFNKGTAFVNTSTFTENSATLETTGDYAFKGGAILNTGKLTVNHSLFEGNLAVAPKARGIESALSVAAGGAIYNDKNTANSINFCSFSNNSASALYTCSLDGCLNNAGAFGGAVLTSGETTITETSFDFNTAQSDTRAIGGALLNNPKGNTTTIDCAFTDNSASAIQNEYSIGRAPVTDGGAIYTADSYGGYATTFIIDLCLFKGNTAIHGSAIFNTGDGNVVVNSSTFADNRGQRSGAMWTDGQTDIANSTFTNNSASASYGGAIFNVARVNATNCTFEGNSCYTSGGAFYNFGYSTLNSSVFINNFAASEGGAVYNSGGAIIMRSCEFTQNEAPNGGAFSNNWNATVSNSLFTNNIATYNGSAIYQGARFVSVINCQFSDNTAQVGDPIYISSGTVIVEKP